MTVKRVTRNKFPLWVIPKIAKEKTKTIADWPNMTANWVMTWEKRSSIPLIPFTRDRSRIPSFLSSNIAPEVNATAKKNIILKKNLCVKCVTKLITTSLFCSFLNLETSLLSKKTYVSMTPGAAKSVKSGLS